MIKIKLSKNKPMQTKMETKTARTLSAATSVTSLSRVKSRRL